MPKNGRKRHLWSRSGLTMMEQHEIFSCGGFRCWSSVTRTLHKPGDGKQHCRLGSRPANQAVHEVFLAKSGFAWCFVHSSSLGMGIRNKDPRYVPHRLRHEGGPSCRATVSDAHASYSYPLIRAQYTYIWQCNNDLRAFDLTAGMSGESTEYRTRNMVIDGS